VSGHPQGAHRQGTEAQADAKSDEKAAKLRSKALQRAQQVPQLLAEVAACETRLDVLLGQLAAREPDLAVLRRGMEAQMLQSPIVTT
jgi:hypothetical protein